MVIGKVCHLLYLDPGNSIPGGILQMLERNGFSVTICESLKACRQLLGSTRKFDLLVMTERAGARDLTSLISGLNQDLIKVPSIILTGLEDVRYAVEAMQAGVRDYLLKPVSPDDLLASIKGVITSSSRSHKPVQSDYGSHSVVFLEGTDEVSKELYSHIRLVGPTELTILIEGESGTGKEHIARYIHQLSKRKDGPFVAVDCGVLTHELAASELFGHERGAFTGAIQEKMGQFEYADGGTLFLDEIGNLDYEVQIKLLRALQEREITPLGGISKRAVDVRIIVATNDDLRDRVLQGNFREDLYYRLNEFTLKVQPLRERLVDFETFLAYFLDRTNRELGKKVMGFSEELREFLRAHNWPGNLRELQNTVRRIVLLTEGSIAEVESLPKEMRQGEIDTVTEVPAYITDLKQLQSLQEKEMIEEVLDRVRFNKSKAARILGIDRKTLYLKMSKYGLG